MNFLYLTIILPRNDFARSSINKNITCWEEKHKIIPHRYELGMILVLFLFMTRYFFVNCTSNHTITNNNQ